jgi:DNA invertase Pin-like site-specific DNA recombinase
MIRYGCVSTQDHSLDLQGRASIKASAKKVRGNKASSSRAEWAGRAKAPDRLRDGDTLVVSKRDRLSRRITNLVDLPDELCNQGAPDRSLDGTKGNPVGTSGRRTCSRLSPSSFCRSTSTR